MDVLSIVQSEGYKQVNSIDSKIMDSPSMTSRSSSSGYRSVLPDEIAELAATTGIQGQANITLLRSESMPTGFGEIQNLDQLHWRSPSLDIPLNQFNYDSPNASIKEQQNITTLVKCASVPSIPTKLQPGQPMHLPSPSPYISMLSVSNHDVIVNQSDDNSGEVFEQHDLEPEVLVSTPPVLPSTAQADNPHDTCEVCLAETRSILMPCCYLGLCTGCLHTIIEAKLDAGITYIVCPSASCQGTLQDAYIRQCLAQNEDLLGKYSRFRVAHSGSQTEKLCPFCSHVTVHHAHEGKAVKKLKEFDVAITCEVCSTKWCFSCHAPWHSGINCVDFRKGNKQFTKWLKQRKGGTVNAQRCPKCAIPIQRTQGCDRMRCTNCFADFCYACGSSFKGNFILGNHYKPLTIYGCKNRYKGSAAEREAVRYGYLFTKCTFLAAYPVVFIGAVAVVAVGGLGFLAYKGVRKLKKK